MAPAIAFEMGVVGGENQKGVSYMILELKKLESVGQAGGSSPSGIIVLERVPVPPNPRFRAFVWSAPDREGSLPPEPEEG